MADNEIRQQIKDEEHLKLLSLGYMVSAGMTAFFSLFGLMYVFMGTIFTSFLSYFPQAKNNPEPPPDFIGWIFTGFGLAIFVFGVTIALLKWRASRCLKERHSITFCQVIAGLTCLSVPYGTLLGVLTFVVLARPSIVALFHQKTNGA